jgi:tripartite-type tricarboxylate transporter receptor subunit TctC
MMLARLFCLGLIAVAPVALAQDYPNRSPTIVVPFAAGGPNDVIGRETAEALTQKMGRAFTVENRAGAGGVTGMRYVMSAKPDGYTLFAGSPGPLVISPIASGGSLVVEGNLMPIGVISESPQVLVVSSKLPIKTITELAEYAKARPGELNYGSAGVGTTPHLSAELFRQLTGVAIQHVPYRGTSAAIPDLIRGELNLLFGDVATLKTFIEAGSVRALGVTGAVRSPLLPDVPSAAEAGFPKLIVRNFSVLLAPIGTPEPVIKALSDALDSIKKDGAFVARMERNGMSVFASSPEHARDYMRTERAIWEPVVKAIDLKLSN